MRESIENGDSDDGLLADRCFEHLVRCGWAVLVFEIDDIGVTERIS